VLENILVPVLAHAAATPEQMQRAQFLVDRVGLTDRCDHRPSELSGGERQRVAFCRALICKPSLVLADEPTGNLDSANADTVTELLLRLQIEQRDDPSKLIVVTHSESVAEKMNRRLYLRNGICS